MRKPRARRRGMGSIFKHGRSLYIAYYFNGKQIKEKIGPIGLVTKGQAEMALKARMGEIVQGKFNLEKKTEDVKFSTLIEQYLKYSKENHRSYTRSVSITKVLFRYLGDKFLDQITSWDVETYKINRKKECVAPSTINRELTVFKRMFNLAIQWNLAESNPVKEVKFFKVVNQPMRILSDEDYEKLYNNASEHIKPILCCAINTGMRINEILCLKWKDVNLKDDTLTVRDTKNSDYRVIPINNDLKLALMNLKTDINNEFVFTYDNKKIKRIDKSFKTALSKAKIPKCRFHDLRHTFATNLVMKGVDLVTVKELLGHKSILMTQRYSHPTPEHKRAALVSLMN